MTAALDDLVALLALEPIEVNIFRGMSPDENRQRVFGGQVAGQALMAIGQSTGENRAVEAAQAAIESPLLDVNIHGATGVLFNVASSGTLGLHELNMAAQVIAEVVDPGAEIIFGSSTDPELDEEVKITLIAVGFSPERTQQLEDEDEEYKRLRTESLDNKDDTDLPTFLRRPASIR